MRVFGDFLGNWAHFARNRAGMAYAITKAMTKVLPFMEPHSTAVREAQNQSSVPGGAPDKRTPTGDHARTPGFDRSLGLHAFVGFACLALLGLGFLLLETGDWIFFLSFGATSCAVGVAASGRCAYHSGSGRVMRSVLFALPVLVVGVAARIGLSPSKTLPLDVWCAFGVLMFIASYAGGLTGAFYGKKRHPKRIPGQYCSSQQTALSVMKENEPPIAPEVLNQTIPNSGMSRKWKILLAFGLGVLLVVQTYALFWLACNALSSELGDVVKWLCILVGAMWVCFLVAQFLLSRGNPRAVLQDWPVIAALNFAPFCSVIVVWVLVTGAAALAMLVAANITLGCSCAGAALAAFIARRRARKIALQAG